MDLFVDRIGLIIPSCNWISFYAIVVLTHLSKFSHKFGTTIKHNSLWKWIMSKPSFLGNICNFCSRFIVYLCHLGPACGRIDYCEAPQFERIFYFPRDFLWANEVYTYRVPGIGFSLFGWQLAIFLISCFGSLACWSLLTNVVDCCMKTFPVEMFTESMLCASLSLMTEHLMIPIYICLL